MSLIGALRRHWTSRLTAAKSRARQRSRRGLSGIERLEDRSLLFADLIGIDFEVSDSTFAPGAAVPVTWQLANQGFSTAPSGFDLQFYLSRDSFISPADLFVGSRFLPAGFPAFSATFPQFDTIFLPPETNPIWNGSGTYFLGMVVDPSDFVFELDESNNANQGFGFDLDALAISVASAQQPDLLGTSLALNTANPAAGGLLNISFSVNNSGGQAAGPFQISFFLSADANISASDRLLGTSFSGGLSAGGTLNNSTSLTLPVAGDPIYAGGGPLFLGLLIDSGNAVVEGNELNNANRGLGLDTVQFTLGQGGGGGGGGALEELPATGFPPGELYSEFLLRARKYIDTAVADYKGLAKSAKGVVDVSQVTKSLKVISTDLGKIRSLIQPLRKGSKAAVNLGGGVSLTREHLELVERFIISLLRDEAGEGAFAVSKISKPAAFAAAAVANANDDDFATLESAKRAVLDMFDPSRIFGEAAAAFDRAAGVATSTGQAAAAGLAAQASTIATAIGRMARFGRAKILEGDPLAFDQARGQAHETLGSAIWDEITNEIREHLPEPNSAGERLLNLLDHLETANEVITANFDRIRDNFQALFTADRANAFRGKWVGEQSSEINIGGNTFFDGGPMSLNFSKAKNGAIPGTAVVNFHVLDESGNVVGKAKTTGKFSGHFTDNETFEGSIELRAPNGLQETLPFSWRFDGNSLTGALYQGSRTTFSIRKK